MRVMNYFEATVCYPMILSTALRYEPTDITAVMQSSPSHIPIDSLVQQQPKCTPTLCSCKL
jgi:hypothetical protein